MKLLSIGLIAALLTERSNKRIVLCHGCFDLAHVGHVKYLEAAKKFGDVLVVTITPDSFVNKGKDRPIFNQTKRAEVIAAIGCVDYVAVNFWETAVGAIRLLRPNVYVKGPECKDKPTPGLLAEIEAMREIGGVVAYTDGEVHSSTAIIEALRC